MSVNTDIEIPDAPINNDQLIQDVGDAPADGVGVPAPTDAEAPAAHVTLRALILSSDASIIIGKGGKHINEIRTETGARLMITPAVPGSQERILSVAGPLDAVSRAFGLLVRRINDEPFGQPSLPGAQSYTFRLVVPNSRMGSVIGKAGSKIKEIQEASGARLQASEAMLPGSTERILSIAGVADAVHIAVYYVGVVLTENQDRGSGANLQYRPGAQAVAAGVMQPFYGAGAPAPGMAGAPAPGGPRVGLSGGPPPPGSQTQQIYIPDDLVGSVIGKGGSKINEIRQASGTHVKIDNGSTAVPGTVPTDRLVSITGPAANIQVAITMLHQRVEEERRRLSATQL